MWIQTYTGKQFFPFDPKPDQIDITDIAHALSNTCRYTGHCRYYYSVAQHSVHVAEQLEGSKLALAGLLHDASEAYLADVARPIKGHIEGYADLEKTLDEAIAEKFGVEYPWPDAVKDVDTRILFDERAVLLGPSPADWGIDAEPLGIHIVPWANEGAKAAFLGLFNYLMTMRDYH